VGDSGASQSVGRSHSHLCWVFDDYADFRAAAVEYLADGLARGLRVRYIAELAPLERLEEARRPGAVEVLPVSGSYAGSARCVDSRTQVELYAADTRTAVAAGFTGLRVAADATMLVRTPAQLDAFARYEHQVDRYITLAPFSALCGYRRSEPPACIRAGARSSRRSGCTPHRTRTSRCPASST
jgi:DcmR-like sensory protein